MSVVVSRAGAPEMTGNSALACSLPRFPLEL